MHRSPYGSFYPKMDLKMKKKIIDNTAPAGIVINQDAKIPRTTVRLIALIPFAKPTPRTAPTKV